MTTFLEPTRARPVAGPRRRPRPGSRTTVSAAVARRLFIAGVQPAPGDRPPRGPHLGQGGPEMTIHRPEEFFAPARARTS